MSGRERGTLGRAAASRHAMSRLHVRREAKVVRDAGRKNGTSNRIVGRHPGTLGGTDRTIRSSVLT